MKRKFRKYRRFKRFKKRKSILKSRFFWSFVLILALIILVFYFFFLSKIFRIKEINISAPDDISQKEIQALLEEELETPFFYFFHKNTFFLVNSQKIEDRILKEYPEIKEVTLEKKFPKSLNLEIKKREAAGIWCFSEDNCFLIDKEGIIFQGIFRELVSEGLVKIFSEDEKVKNLGGKVIAEEKINQLLEIHHELEENLRIGVERFTLSEGERLDVKTIEEWEIYFDLAGDINLALTKLGLLLEKEIPPEDRENLQYIDFRFSKVYYK